MRTSLTIAAVAVVLSASAVLAQGVTPTRPTGPVTTVPSVQAPHTVVPPRVPSPSGLPPAAQAPRAVTGRSTQPGVVQAPPPDCAHDARCDADGDGHIAGAYGGDDCDDANPNRYPGNHEVADAGIDQDCDAMTIGVRDEDRDGYTDNSVFNVADGSNWYGTVGTRFQGDDCDDHQGQIHPNAQELPNHIDDNCDGLVDNLLGDWYTPAPRR
jgi:putative metal-binding protein